MQLFNKFNLLSFITISLAMFISSFYISYSSEARVKDSLLHEQLVSSEIAANLIEDKLSSLREMVNIQSNVDIIKESAAKFDTLEFPALSIKLNKYIDELYVKTNKVGTFIVLDLNGVVISSSNKNAFGMDLSTRSYYASAIDGQATYIAPLFSQLSNAPVVIMSEPLVYEDEVVGVVVVAIDLPAFSRQVFSGSKIFFDSKMYVVNRNGLVVLSTNEEDILNYSLRSYNWFEQIDLSTNGYKTVAEDGVEYIICTSYIEKTDWTIVFIVESKKVFASIRSTFKTLFILNITTLVVILLLFYYITRKRLNKVKQLECIQEALRISSQDNYFIFGEKLEIFFATDKCLEFLKMDSFEYFKQNWHKCNPNFQPDGRPTLDVMMGNLAIAKATGHLEVEYTIYDNYKNEIQTLLNLVPVVYDKKSAFFIMYKDLTEQKHNEVKLAKAKEEAESATKSKSDFLANMSHEIRTPMNGIIGLTYLAMHSKEEGKTLEYLRQIDSSAKSLLRIINDILDFSKITSGKVEIEDVPFQLEVLLEDISVSKISYADKINVDFLINLDDDVPLDLVGDPLRLTQVLTNLLSNALKFTTSGQVVLGIKVAEQNLSSVDLLFSVQDTGIGIASEKLDAIFQSFSQADSSTTRQFGGTGLGLPISRNLVELMGGTLEVKSQIDKGTNFCFRLRFGVIQSAERPKQNPKLPALKILVVDDNQVSLKLISKYLENIVNEVDLVDSGEKALKLYEKSLAEQVYYDVLLLDWKMPDMDGIELAKQIRALETSANSQHKPSILMVTAFNRDELLPQLKEHDIKDVLVKPVSSSKLWNSINKAYYGAIPKNKSITESTPPTIQFVKQYVLLAEDNTINQMIATELLENVGLMVDIASNGQTAVDMARVRDYSLILMDIQMPILDGLSACSVIRKDPHFHEQPIIIAMTAHAMLGDREKSLEAGMQDHITKPINPDEFYEILARYLPQKPA